MRESKAKTKGHHTIQGIFYYSFIHSGLIDPYYIGSGNKNASDSIINVIQYTIQQQQIICSSYDFWIYIHACMSQTCQPLILNLLKDCA